MLRSWEERFAVTLVEVAPGRITLVVEAPPTDTSHAINLAAEHYAIAAQEAGGRPGALRGLAHRLRADPPLRTDDPIRRHLWELAPGA